MGDLGFFDETDSRENEGILGGSEENNEEKKEEEAAVLNRQQATFNLDLNLQPEEVDSGNGFSGLGLGLGFDFGFGFPEKETENFTKSESVVFGVDLKRMERYPDVEIVGSSSKKRRFSVQEKGKAKLDGFDGEEEKMNLDLDLGLMQIEIDKSISFLDPPVEAEKQNYTEIEFLGSANPVNPVDHVVGEVNYKGIDEMDDFHVSRKREESRRHHEIARKFAQRLAHEVDSEGDLLKSSTKTNKDGALRNVVVVDEDDKAEDLQSPFGMAIEMIKTRNSSSTARKRYLSGCLEAEFKWVPKNNKGSSLMAREVPSLLDLSLRTLAKNAEAIVSLKHVPDMLRHRLNRLVCDSRKMDAHFVELLASGSPTEIRVNDCSRVTEDEFTKIFGCCDTKNLIVLQLDLCGSCMPDYVLQDTLARSSKSLPALVTLSLNGAYRLSDKGLNALAMSAPALQSINLSQCSLLTSAGINNLASCFESTLRELYLDECQNIEAMVVLPALKKLKCLEVLSLAGIQTVSDDFVIGMVEACGKNMKELVFANCVELTNSICNVFSDGGGCPMLKSLVLDNCESLTAVQFSSTSLVSLSLVGCRAITTLDLACPCLEKICLDGCDHLERASFYPAALRSLNLGICPKLNTLRIDAPYMASLELKGCGVLSEASINCPLLTSLDASFCSQLNDAFLSATTASFSLIESLILMSCPSIGSDGLYSLRWLPNLTTLDLSYTFLTNLQPVLDYCLHLKVLKLQACKYLADSSLEPLYKKGALRELEDLDLSYGTLCHSAIEELLVHCTHLTHMSLNGYINMHDLNWGSTGGQLFESLSVHNGSSMFSFENINEPIKQANRLLQNLNCVGCPNIRKVLIPPAARCFHLSSLNLSLSANLKEVDLACFNLSFLNLSNCCSLEVLKLGCPRLTSLFLQSCNIEEEAVETAITQCSMLETLDVRFCPKIFSSMGRLRAVCPSLKRIFSSLSPA